MNRRYRITMSYTQSHRSKNLSKNIYEKRNFKTVPPTKMPTMFDVLSLYTLKYLGLPAVPIPSGNPCALPVRRMDFASFNHSEDFLCTRSSAPGENSIVLLLAK